ncbi:MAG: hypothetical protein V3T72_09595, partial [Thermoanaerobaculia bacterium]
TDTFPAALTCSWTSAADGGAAGNTAGSGPLGDTLSLPADSSVTYTVVCAVDAGATGTVSNTATIASEVNDPIAANNSATDVDTLDPVADVAISKEVDLSDAVGGGTLVYTVTAANLGPSAAPSAGVEDAFPTGLACGWTSAASGGATGNTVAGAGDLSEVLALPAGSSVVYSATCEIDLDVSGTLRNTATIAAAADPDASNDAAVTTTEVQGIADLGIELSGPDTAVPGTELTGVTYTVFNRGPQDVVGARILAPFPPQLDATSWTCTASAGGSCNAGPVAGNLDDFFDLAVGASAVYTVTATVRSAATGTVDLSGMVLTPPSLADPNPLDNAAGTSIELLPETDLAVSLDDERDEAIAGKRLRYFVTVENSGPSDAPAVDLTTSFPLEGLSWVCTTSGGLFCGTGTDVLDVTFDLAAANERQYRVVAEVPADATGEVRSTALVSSEVPETDPPDEDDNFAEDVDVLVSGEVDDLSAAILLEARNPDVTVTSEGQAVVVFERDEDDGSIQIYRQVLDTSAQPVPGGLEKITDGPLGAIEPSITTFVAGSGGGLGGPDEGEAEVDKAASDDTMEVWTVPGDFDIKGKLTASNIQFDVSLDLAPVDRRADSGSLIDGPQSRALAVWQRTPSVGDDPARVIARRIDELGAFGPEIQVTSQGSQARVAARTNQQYLVVWRVGGKIKGRRVDREGNLVGMGETVLSTGDGSEAPQVAYYRAQCDPPCPADDRFLVAWRRQGQILGRLYDKNLVPQVGPFPITTLCPDEFVSLTGTEDGNFILTVESSELTNAGRNKTIDPADGSVAGESGPCKNKGEAPPADSGFRLSTAPAPRGTIVGDSPVFFATWDRPSSEDIRNQIFVLTADLVVEVAVPPEAVFAGDTLIYTITVSNVSQTDARDVVMSHLLPPEAALPLYSGCAADPDAAVSCTLGTLAGNSLQQYTLTVELADDLDAVALVLEVSASSPTRDADATDNSTTLLTPVGEADLEVTIAGPTEPVTAGSTVPLAVTVRNAGPSAAAAVELSAPPAAGVLAISADGCTENANGIPTCSLGVLLPDEERALELAAEIAEGAPAMVDQTVTVTTLTFDPEPADNTATATITVLTPELAVVLEAPGTATAGEIMTLSATVSNPGDAAAVEVALGWVLPPSLTPRSSVGCEEDLGAPTCTLGTLQPGAAARADLEVEIDAGFSGVLAVAANATSPSLSSVASASAETAVTATDLTLLGGRFEVRVDWLTADAAGAGQAVPFSDNTGFFWFFGPENFELVVKTLDGRGINDHFWLFYGALSDVEYDITVTDLDTGTERIYHNAAGNLCGQADTLAFPATGSEPAAPLLPDRVATTGAAGKNGACVPDAGSLCLAGGRFRVEVDWRNQ